MPLQTSLRTDLPSYMQEPLWRHRVNEERLQDALRDDSTTQEVLDKLRQAHNVARESLVGIIDTRVQFMGRTEESAARNNRESRDQAFKVIERVMPGLESAIKRGRGRSHELGNGILRMLARSAKEWPYADEVRYRVLTAGDDQTRYKLVESFIKAGDRDSAGAVLGAPVSTTALVPQHFDLLRNQYDDKFFADVVALQRALKAGADLVEQSAQALLGEAEHLHALDKHDAHVKQVERETEAHRKQRKATPYERRVGQR